MILGQVSTSSLNWPAEKIEVAEMVIQETERIGFDDPILPLAIVLAESRGNPKAQNPASSAYGPFQFLTSTFDKFCEGNKKDPRHNIRCGVKLIARGELHHWYPSFEFWWKLYPSAFISWAKMR